MTMSRAAGPLPPAAAPAARHSSPPLPPTQRRLLPVVLLLLLAARPALPQSCVDQNSAIQSLIGVDCATVARLSRLPGTANNNPGVCMLLNVSGMLDLCCASCLAIDECESNPCLNGGVCHAPNTSVSYSCDCAKFPPGTTTDGRDVSGIPAFDGHNCENGFVPREICPADYYITEAANDTEAYARIGCWPPTCHEINDGDERCRQCTVCGPGYTFTDPCTNVTDTVCVPTVCQPFPGVHDLNVHTDCEEGAVYPYPHPCLYACDEGWASPIGETVTQVVCHADTSWSIPNPITCTARCEDVPGWCVTRDSNSRYRPSCFV